MFCGTTTVAITVRTVVGTSVAISVAGIFAFLCDFYFVIADTMSMSTRNVLLIPNANTTVVSGIYIAAVAATSHREIREAPTHGLKRIFMVVVVDSSTREAAVVVVVSMAVAVVVRRRLMHQRR